jgi:hypothetical protein
MYRVPRFIQKFTTRVKVSTTPLHIHKSKLQATVAIDERFGNTCKSKVFCTILGSISSTRIV